MSQAVTGGGGLVSRKTFVVMNEGLSDLLVVTSDIHWKSRAHRFRKENMTL